MLKMKSFALELRGIANRTRKDGSVYYLVNVEDDEGTPYQFFCKDASAFPAGLKRGDIVDIEFDYRKFDKNDNLFLSRVIPVS